MKQGIYSVKDSVVGAYMRPFVHVNDATAVRDFSNSVNDPRNDFMIQNHSDMSLYRLGWFDDQTGVVEADEQFICTGSSLWKEVVPNNVG